MRIKQGPYTEQIDLFKAKERTIMAETKMAVEKETGLFAHLCRQRNGAAKVFPHCGEKGFAFSRRVQGFKLSEASLKALKRG